ncbi:hypothetical protein EXIGLDRAFT_734219 [Exidia glandulosa HHB12029]|uniref:Uncharacterized protein n=1 Tax=Exidia glandulosa HHB12029 TaxID=1314781 RepID=A0A165K7W4_EXIGL|nr:hypothetical protein EXIGLDRAFT_734219 [Exidia glandulosa HHB12029]
MTSLQSLPQELHALILKFVDEIATLRAAVLTYRPFYTACYDNENAVRRSVLGNLVGPKMRDAALRSVRVPAYMPTHREPEPGQPGSFVQVVKTNLSEAAMSAQAISDDELRILCHRARVCNELEVLYSRWHKDRLTGNQSLLTLRESDDFRLCIYRLWLLSLYTAPGSIVSNYFNKVEHRELLFYSDYTPQEVFNLHLVIDWMHEVVRQCELPDGRTQNAYHLQCIVGGPELVLDIYMHPEKLAEYLKGIKLTQLGATIGETWTSTSDLQHVFKTHHLLSPNETVARIPDGIVPIVLPRVPVSACWKCGGHPGERVWNEDNWDHAPRNLRIESLVHWLPASLKENNFERPLFLNLLGVSDPESRAVPRRKKQAAVKTVVRTIPGMTVTRVLRALCKLPPHAQDLVDVDSLPLKPDDFEGISCTDLLCATCLKAMVTNRLWILWLKEKERAAPSEAEKGNCWYGIECRLQSFKPDHASRYNHACRNTWPEREASKRADREAAAARAANTNANIADALVSAPSASTATA